MRSWGLCASLSALLVSGCAGLTVGPVKDDNQASGYRFYQPAPFLFVRSDGKGGLTSEIIYLPDTTQKMSARPFAVLASNNATLSFSNGMLTEASAVVDETVVPAAFLDALSKGASAAIAADLPQTPQATAPVPYLFKITVHAGSIELKGGPAFGPNGTSRATINVAITPPGGK
nr:hypothetical protein [uncultured Rhodopila sp.]